tara:strand:+ start:79 stop:243 length:165 start_codon:yes stop_codon:yes gene_type:complete
MNEKWGEILLVLESLSESVKMYAPHQVVKNNPRPFGDFLYVMREPRGYLIGFWI